MHAANSSAATTINGSYRIKRTKHNLTLATAYEVIDMDMEVEVEVDDPLLRLLMMRHLRCLTQ